MISLVRLKAFTLTFWFHLNYVLYSANDGHCQESESNLQKYSFMVAHPKTTLNLDYLHQLSDKGFITPLTVIPREYRPLLFLVKHKFENVVKHTLSGHGMAFDVVSENLTDFMEKNHLLTKPSGRALGGDFDYTSYHKYEEIIKHLQDLETKNPSVVKLDFIGTSAEGKQIPIVKLQDPVQPMPDQVIIECGVHAREWISISVCLWLINAMLTNDAEQPILSVFTFNFIVIANPDGYIHTWKSNRLWRRNRSNVHRIPKDECVGVDINRNWGFAFCKEGSSKNPCEDTYCGPAPFSEPETRAIRDTILKIAKDNTTGKLDKLKMYIALHNAGQLLLYPYGTPKVLPGNHLEYERLSKLGTEAIFKTHGKNYTAGPIWKMVYPASGSSVDWSLFETECQYSFGIELRDKGKRDLAYGFGFLIPAYEIKPASEEVWNGIKAMLYGIVTKDKTETQGDPTVPKRPAIKGRSGFEETLSSSIQSTRAESTTTVHTTHSTSHTEHHLTQSSTELSIHAEATIFNYAFRHLDQK